MLKRCSKCGCVKDITDFHHNRTKKDGYQPYCKDCQNEYQKEFYKGNKEKRREYMREYTQTEKGKIVQIQAHKKYEQTEKGIMVNARAAKKFSQTPKGKMVRKKVMHKRRARMKNTEATLTLEQWTRIIKLQNNECNISKQKFTKRRLPTMDHIIPLSKGGGLTFENAQALCRSCNSAKKAKLDLGFIQTWSHRQ